MKKKHLLWVLGLLVLILSIFLFYYRFDPSLLSRLSFYVDLANPYVKVVRVQEGLRKEEIAENIGDRLGWSEEEKQEFLKIHLAQNTIDLEGMYFPKTYLINETVEPTEVSAQMLEEFEKEVGKIEEGVKDQIINRDTALKIASLIQREAAGKHDMRLISGIIWNRLFLGMNLQIDATLQYVKGSEEEGWWQRVYPEDKKLESEYNTYLNPGLPPGAIANPGPAAIAAAYNPLPTKCLFYLHDKNRKIHCSPNYEGHKRNIEIYY
jgi:UPF0755 protein